MTRHSETFPWPPYYGHFNFFEQKMRIHNRVASLHPCGDGVYELVRTIGQPLKLFVCECYSFGAAEYYETVAKVENLNAIVINSIWCGYTTDAKRISREAKVGLFKIRDFMAALNKVKFWEYLDTQEQKIFEEKGWL